MLPVGLVLVVATGNLSAIYGTSASDLGHVLVVATGNLSATPYGVTMIVGVLVGIFGHLAKSNLIVALGIGVILVATVLFIAATDPSLG